MYLKLHNMSSYICPISRKDRKLCIQNDQLSKYSSCDTYSKLLIILGNVLIRHILIDQLIGTLTEHMESAKEKIGIFIRESLVIKIHDYLGQ